MITTENLKIYTFYRCYAFTLTYSYIFQEWGRLPFTFTPWVDGEYLPDHPAKMIFDGRHAKVDIISGVTRDEGALFALRKNLKYCRSYVILFPHAGVCKGELYASIQLSSWAPMPFFQSPVGDREADEATSDELQRGRPSVPYLKSFDWRPGGRGQPDVPLLYWNHPRHQGKCREPQQSE